MVAGLLIMNEYGSVQIDETYKNLCLRPGAGLSFGNTSPNSDLYDGSTSFIDSTLPHAVAIGQTGDRYFCVNFREDSGSLSRYRLLFTGPDISGEQYYRKWTYTTEHLDDDHLPANPLFTVRNGDNQLTYHEMIRPLRILEYLSGNTDDGSFSRSYPDVDEIAVISNNLGLSYRNGNGDPNTNWWIRNVWFKVNGNALEGFAGEQFWGKLPDRTVHQTILPWSALVVDVSWFYTGAIPTYP